MPDPFFVLDAAFKDLITWISAYGERCPPPSGGQLRRVIDDKVPIGRENGSFWLATVYAGSRGQPEVRLMTLKVAEENGKCRTSLRCMDPDSETWFQDLVDFLAPDDPTGDAARDGYPLPELPSLGTTPEPPVAAPAPSPGPAERDAPHVPSRSAARRRWKAAWQRMKPLVAQGKSNDYIVGWFMKHSDDIQPSKESVIRIIAAGEAGLLE